MVKSGESTDALQKVDGNNADKEISSFYNGSLV